MPGKVLIAAAVLLAGAGFPTSDLYLGRVAGTADAVDSTRMTLEPAKPSVSVRVSNTTGKPGRVVGWLGDKAATAVAPDHSSIVTLTWDSPAVAGGDSGVLRLELYAEGDTLRATDIEEHPYAVANGYQPPHESPKPSAKPSDWKTPGPKPSDSKSPGPKPSDSKSPGPKPSESKSESPKPHTPSASPSLPQTGADTSFVAVLGGGSVLFGMLLLGVAWVLRRRSLRDQIS